MHKDVMTVTELRSNIYQVVDHVLDTGEPCEVMRDGRAVIIMPKKSKKKMGAKNGRKPVHWLEKLEKMGPRRPSAILCNEETLIYGKLDEWNEHKNW